MKTGVKISLWIVGVGAGLYLAYLIFMGIGLFGGIYTYTITYPAACWTDDGKQIIYLENRQIDKSAIMPMIVRGGRIIQSKTYLMIMDANSKNKKVVGEYEQPKTYNELFKILEDMLKSYKIEYEKLKIMLGPKAWEIESKIENKKDLQEKWKNLSYTRYLEISPDTKYLLFLDTRYGIMKMDWDGKTKLLVKIEKDRKSYLFLPPWWKV